MDILQPLPIDQWSLLRDSLKRDWPTYAYYYYFVNNAIKWKKKEPEFKLQICCPHGDVNAGTFIGISTQSWRSVYIFTFEESKELLRRVLVETKLIDWTELNFFTGVHSHFNAILEDFVEDYGGEKHITMQLKGKTYNYFKPRDECLQLDVTVPEECELQHLNESHIPLIHSLWPHRSEEQPEQTTGFLASMVRLNRGIGLFLKKDGSLVSWIIHFDWGGLGMLQTVEEHKQKGYARVVMKALAKALAEEENLDSFAFIIDTNTPSLKLFESLGYRRLESPVYFHLIQPQQNKVCSN